MRIILIGMAGVGKSYIGKKLADKLKMHFLDIDESLKMETGMDTTALLEKIGDREFLKIENEVFERDIEQKETVFAPGGSIIYCSNFINNLDKFKVFYLKGDIKTIIRRIKKQPRGIVYSGQMSLTKLMKEREKLYEKYADFVINAERDPDTIIKEICDTIFIENNNIC